MRRDDDRSEVLIVWMFGSLVFAIFMLVGILLYG